MFGIGMPEMLLILAVALIVFGPKRLPELAKSLGRALGEFKRATSDLKQSIETDTGLDGVRNSIEEVKKDIKAQVDLTGAPAAPPSKSAAEKQSDEPLSKVKAAFDQMNADSDPSVSAAADTEAESEAGQPDIDPDTRPQGSTIP